MPAHRKFRPRYPDFEDRVASALLNIVRGKSLTNSDIGRMTGMSHSNVSTMLSHHDRVHWSNRLEMLTLFGIDVVVTLTDADGERGGMRLEHVMRSAGRLDANPQHCDQDGIDEARLGSAHCQPAERDPVSARPEIA